MKRFLELNRPGFKDILRYTSCFIRQENDLFKLNFRLRPIEAVNYNSEIESIPISNKKMFELMNGGTIDYTQLNKSICFIEDTETNNIEPFYIDNYEVKKLIKNISIPEENLTVGDKVVLWDSNPYYTYYYGGFLTDDTNESRLIYVMNQGGGIEASISKPYRLLKIIKKEPGLTQEELNQLFLERRL